MSGESGTTMQQKITRAVYRAALSGGVADRGVEFVEYHSYANQGTWYVMNGLDTLLEIRFSFQDGYGNFTVTGPLAQAKPPETDFRWRQVAGEKQRGYLYPHTSYSSGDQLRLVTYTVWRLMAGWKQAEEKKAEEEMTGHGGDPVA